MNGGPFSPFSLGRDLEPLPGRGAADPKFDRLAGAREALENTLTHLDKTGDRGTGQYPITLTAERLASEARSPEDLARLVRRTWSSHLITGEGDAEKLARTAFDAFARRQRVNDPDFAWLWTSVLMREYKERQVRARRERVGQIARALEADPIFRARLEWTERVEQLAQETGLDPEFVEQFLVQFNQQTQPRFPGKIDPRGLPFVQIGVQRYAIAYLIKEYTPAGAPFQLYEAVTGEDILTGRELATWERVLGIVAALLPALGKFVGKAIGTGVRVGVRAARTVAKGVTQTAGQLASISIQAGLSARSMLRFIGRVGRIPADRLRSLLDRVRRARAARQALRLTDEDHRLMRELDEAFREFGGGAAAQAAPKLAKPTARAFIFLTRLQPQVLGRLLGRPLSQSAARLGTRAAQQAEDIAANIAARIRAHWDAALPKGVRSAADAAQRAFDELKRVNPANPNTFVRQRLYDAWRTRAMRRIYRDGALVRDLKEHAGIIVGRNPKTKTITIHVRTKSPTAKRVQTHLDFDHGATRHEDAVRAALRADDPRPLVSTVDSANLQLMTARENRNFIEALRKAEREMGTATGSAAGSATAAPVSAAP